MSAHEIITELKALSNSQKAEKMMHFFKTDKDGYAKDDIFWGVPVPEQRKIAKKNKDISLSELSGLVSHPVHDVRHLALCLLVYKAEKASDEDIEKYTEFYLSHLPHVNSWDLVDASSRFILGPYLEHRNRALLYQLAESENVWERRISIITCLYFIKQRDFKDALQISDLLINDKQDLIQKAVGWMLREIGNLDYEAEYVFLIEDDRYQKMPRTMLRYAIEKFDDTVRKQFLNSTI